MAATILMVDDYPPNLLALEAALQPLEERLVRANSGTEALKFLLAERCSLILLDVNMPGTDGFETAAIIRSRPRTRDIPILFLTATAGQERAHEAYEVGAVDYIIRPFEPQVLRTKVRALLDLRERAARLEQDLARSEDALAQKQRLQIQAERRLERRYRGLVEATGQIVWSTNAAGEVVEDSPSWRAFTGQTLLQSLGTGWMDAMHPEDRVRTERAWREAVASRQRLEIEYRLRKHDGCWADVLARAVPVVDDDGSVLEWLGTNIDLTEHKRADREVRASRDQLDAILGSVAEGITAQDAEGRLVFANDEAARMSGLASGSEMLGEGTQAIVGRFEMRDESGAPFPPERLPGRNALERGRPHSALLRVRRKDGKDERWVLVRSTPVVADGKTSLVINVVQDVTEQRRSEFAAHLLSEAGRVLGSSLESDSPVEGIARVAVPRLADWCAVDVRDEEGAIRLLTAVHGDGTQGEEARAASGRDSSDPRLAEHLAAVLRTGATESDRTLIIAPLRARGQVLGTLSLGIAGSGRSFGPPEVRIAEELADRAAAALDNARLYRRAQEAVRARDDFLSIASHELRTPLTPLRLQTQVLRRLLESGGPAPRDRLASSLDTLERQTGRLERLVADLLDVSRISAGKLTLQREQVDLGEVAREVVERYAGGATGRISVSTASVTGRWDRTRLEQVATNLLVNAIKYGEGNSIDVIVQRGPERAVLLVRDRGIGIAPADAKRIFGRFERAASASSFGGLGLGLYIAEQIVRAHGGSISVESAGPGQGSTFQVELPIDDAAGGT